jgi:uncharacterized membrane protein
MATDPKIDHYLLKLERTLAPFPASDRAEILVEIKSHVLSALEHDSNASVESVLTALGEPETVANRYLMERNLKPIRPPVSPIAKWIVVGFLGTFAMTVLLILGLAFKFTPFFKIDGEHLTILGGLIEIDATQNHSEQSK